MFTLTSMSGWCLAMGALVGPIHGSRLIVPPRYQTLRPCQDSPCILTPNASRARKPLNGWKPDAFPTALCHFVNNLAAFVFMRIWIEGDSYELPEGPAMYVVGAALVAVMIVAVFRLRRTEIAER